MQFFDTFLTCYGWEGIALAGAMLAMFGVQLYLSLIHISEPTRPY